jgi:hypothetical protein
MNTCNKQTITIINSQACILGLINLMTEFFKTFKLPYSIDDIFYYGVFCKEETYANFFRYLCPDKMDTITFEVPDILCAPHGTARNRKEYVEKQIDKILIGEIEKPEWMKYVELSCDVTPNNVPISTFLYIKGKKPEYNFLATALKEYLYSMNNMTFLLK